MPSLNTGNAILSNPIKVDSSYNVGIGGAASGSFKLQVTGTTNLTGALTGTSAVFSSSVTASSSTTGTQTMANFAAANYSSPSNRTYIQIGTQFGDGSSRIGSINTTGNQSALVFQTHAPAADVWNDAMYINGSGNVGIGTSSPYANLDLGASGANNIILRNTSNAFNLGYIGNSGGRIDIGFSNSNSSLSPLPYLSITNGGDVFINNNAALFYGSGAGTYIQGGSTQIVCIVNSGGVKLTSGATSWVSNSDERLKTDLLPIENGINKVLTLRALTGRFKTDEEGFSRSFLIAQDIQKVLPEAVYEDTDEDKTLGVRYTEVIPLLVAAIQEQQAQIEAQQQQINSLINR